MYHIQSIEFPNETYIGYTKNLKERLACHNSGGSVYTARHRPWRLVTFHAFDDELKAIRFERYLKSQSGKAFANKRL